VYSEEKLYRCFDPKLKWWLLNHHLRFLIYGRDRDSFDVFWLFERTEEFERLYEEFKKQK
jgi:hypothetical protein